MAIENELEEQEANREAATRLGPRVWNRLAEVVQRQCTEWNAVTREQTLTCKETALGDLRIRCAGREQQIVVHYDSKSGLVIIKNSARPENEPDTVLCMQGYATGNGRDARLVRTTNGEPINPEMMVLGHLRVLAGMARRTE